SASNSYGYTLEGARIVLDPGHNDADPGALGFYPNIDERELNRAIASQTKSILRDLGASVQINPSPSNSSLAGRMSNSLSFEPHLLVCIHCNSGSSSARGTESYYFNSFSQPLASYAAARVSNELDTLNRGAKSGLYYMTRNFAFPATLTEYGFVSNRSEYEELASTSGQKAAARGTVKAIIAFFDSRYNSSSTGTESTNKAAVVQVKGVALDKTKLSVEAGKTVELTATITPENATNQDLTWSSNNTEVATVDEDGVVTGIKAGTAKITVKTDDRGKSAVATVTVTAKPASSSSDPSSDPSSDASSDPSSDPSSDTSGVSGVMLDALDLDMTVGATDQLVATVNPMDADNLDVAWESSDASIVSVDSDGNIVAKKAGTATITVTTVEGSFTNTCVIEVS
ncbi:MAG: Ig-like domain-containing protein, partial [Acetanaerobacterium sp.]